MPSILLANISGGQNLFSGNYWSGRLTAVGGVQLKLDKTASGNAYVGLSGGTTITSGTPAGISGGLLDGMVMYPGEGYFIPKMGLGTISGSWGVWVQCDAAVSGQGRLFYENY